MSAPDWNARATSVRTRARSSGCRRSSSISRFQPGTGAAWPKQRSNSSECRHSPLATSISHSPTCAAASVNSRRALLSRSSASISSCSVMLEAIDSTDSTLPSSPNSGIRRAEKSQDWPPMPLKRNLNVPTPPVVKTLRTARSHSGCIAAGMPTSVRARPRWPLAGTPL